MAMARHQDRITTASFYNFDALMKASKTLFTIINTISKKITLKINSIETW